MGDTLLRQGYGPVRFASLFCRFFDVFNRDSGVEVLGEGLGDF